MLNAQLDMPIVENVPQISQLGNVSTAYNHHLRLVTPGADLSLPRAYLKWYDIRRAEVSISPALRQESREFLAAESKAGRLALKNELGFVMLHQCDTVVFLFVDTWRNENELWKTLYYKDLVNGGGFQPHVFEGSHLPAFCVWELTAVWHEREAWSRYLFSERDDAAKYAYLNDRYSGLL